MSTVIRQAFLINDMKLSKLKSIMEMVKVDVEEIALKRYNSFVENIVKDDFTSVSNGVKKAKANKEWMLRRERIDFENFNDPFVDISCEIIFVPVTNNNVDYLLGFVFTKQKEMYKKLLEIKGATEYFYDDRADKPEGISDEEWKFFEEISSHISTDIITRQGFSIELISKKTIFPYF